MVLKNLKGSEGKTRADIRNETGLPRTTIYDALVRLILKSQVEKFPENREIRGRPKQFYRLSRLS
ncbi:MAG: helix-turn-helix domain-containing protein [Candidatus Paceibacterales bacterium]